MDDIDEAMGSNRSTHMSRTKYDWSAVDPTTAVVEFVAKVAGCDPIALEPLTERVDPDALDAFVRSANEEANLSFHYARHRVTVQGDGEIAVQRSK